MRLFNSFYALVVGSNSRDETAKKWSIITTIGGRVLIFNEKQNFLFKIIIFIAMVLAFVVSAIGLIVLVILDVEIYIDLIAFVFCVIPFIMVRKRIREIKGIKGSLCEDFWLVLCLPCCTMIQAKREFDDYVV